MYNETHFSLRPVPGSHSEWHEAVLGIQRQANGGELPLRGQTDDGRGVCGKEGPVALVQPSVKVVDVAPAVVEHTLPNRVKLVCQKEKE